MAGSTSTLTGQWSLPITFAWMAAPFTKGMAPGEAST